MLGSRVREEYRTLEDAQLAIIENRASARANIQRTQMKTDISEQVFLPTKDAAFRRIDDEVVIVDIANNRLMTLNETGSAIWMMLDGKKVGDIAAALVLAFGVDEAQSLKDTVSFLGELEKRGLIGLSVQGV